MPLKSNFLTFAARPLFTVVTDRRKEHVFSCSTDRMIFFGTPCLYRRRRSTRSQPEQERQRCTRRSIWTAEVFFHDAAYDRKAPPRPSISLGSSGLDSSTRSNVIRFARKPLTPDWRAPGSSFEQITRGVFRLLIDQSLLLHFEQHANSFVRRYQQHFCYCP